MQKFLLPEILGTIPRSEYEKRHLGKEVVQNSIGLTELFNQPDHCSTLALTTHKIHATRSIITQAIETSVT